MNWNFNKIDPRNINWQNLVKDPKKVIISLISVFSILVLLLGLFVSVKVYGFDFRCIFKSQKSSSQEYSVESSGNLGLFVSLKSLGETASSSKYFGKDYSDNECQQNSKKNQYATLSFTQKKASGSVEIATLKYQLTPYAKKDFSSQYDYDKLMKYLVKNVTFVSSARGLYLLLSLKDSIDVDAAGGVYYVDSQEANLLENGENIFIKQALVSLDGGENWFLKKYTEERLLDPTINLSLGFSPLPIEQNTETTPETEVQQ